MKITELFKVRPLAVAVSVASFAAANVYAQEDQVTEETVQVEQQAQSSDEPTEEIIVTGSRISRDTFSSVSPLIQIDANESRGVGKFDAADILQSSTAASGFQIDTTLSGFVLDNGPGASTLSLRGLGADRSLILLNGRRLAPAGVEGAPSAPDLNLLPSGMVERYDLLLDGASTVYGSDAIAGVANVITRTDFDGFEVQASFGRPSQSGGERDNLNLTWGTSGDRGFFGMGVEWQKNTSVSYSDRSWTAQCDKHYEEGLDGKFYSDELYYGEVYNQEVSKCKAFAGGLAGRVQQDFGYGAYDSIYYTPGYSNGGWMGFSESEKYVAYGIDGNGDGVADVSYVNYSLGTKADFAHMYPEVERLSFLANGEYTFEGSSNLTFFGELLYSQRENYTDSGTAQFFPWVPGTNPFNICNPNGVNGVDCGVARDQMIDGLAQDPNYITEFDSVYGAGAWNFYYQNGFLYDGPVGAIRTRPIVNVRGDRTTSDVEVATTRASFGFRGDLPFSDWSWEASLSSSYSEGISQRYGILESRVDLSLATTIEDPNNPGNYICGVDNDGDGVPDGTDGCVPINMFAPSLYEGLIGDFATQAERDYVFGTRSVVTDYYQTVFNAFVSGTLAELPAGDMGAAFGVEYRYDEIDSQPNDVARDGLMFGYFKDKGAVGDKSTYDAFAETSIPLVANAPWATELNVELSARYTKDELYSGAWTGAAKIGYRPVDSLLIRATYGTSYRAPNLRENFLLGLTGFSSVSDPCSIPADAIAPDGSYNPSLDKREPNVLANCLANGIDPTDPSQANNPSIASVEVASVGDTGLEEETSQSLTYGFSFEQPWWDDFDMRFGVSYYDIRVENSIVEPSAGFVVNQCYYAEVSNPSSFCSNITRDPQSYRMTDVDLSFTNRDEERARGIDYSFDYGHEFSVGSEPFSFLGQVMATRLLESSETYVDDQENVLYYDSVGRFGSAEWTGQLMLSLSYYDWTFRWSTNYIGAVSQDPSGVPEFSDIYDTNGTGYYSDSCLGVANGATDCRDVGYADDYMLHNAGVTYDNDAWYVSLTASNVLNDAPPRIDTAQVFGRNNTPLGYGYDLMGRVVSLSVGYDF